MTYLDFEKPIQELAEELEKLKSVAEKSKVDMSKAIAELEAKIHSKRVEIFSNLTAWQRVQISRHPERPYTLAYIDHVSSSSFIELHGDRTVGDDKAMVGGFGEID
jgi:acetyl-CoA carboxylase carboxyl transferase subunit alpha